MRNFKAVTVIFPVINQMKLRASVTLKKKKIPIFTWVVAAVHVRSGSVLYTNLVSYKTCKFEGHQVIAEKHLLQLLFPP